MIDNIRENVEGKLFFHPQKKEMKKEERAEVSPFQAVLPHYSAAKVIHSQEKRAKKETLFMDFSSFSLAGEFDSHDDRLGGHLLPLGLALVQRRREEQRAGRLRSGRDGREGLHGAGGVAKAIRQVSQGVIIRDNYIRKFLLNRLGLDEFTVNEGRYDHIVHMVWH